MNQEFKKEWLVALRSGEYNQAVHQLKTPDGYCCLGVACELLAKEGVVNATKRNGELSFDEEYQTLPKDAMNYMGVIDTNPDITTSWMTSIERDRMRGKIVGGRVSLAELNDNGYSFAQIADLIEKYL